jgi:hypothetical protein
MALPLLMQNRKDRLPDYLPVLLDCQDCQITATGSGFGRGMARSAGRLATAEAEHEKNQILGMQRQPPSGGMALAVSCNTLQ